jgi:hypothetical protein
MIVCHIRKRNTVCCVGEMEGGCSVERRRMGVGRREEREGVVK